MFGHIKKIFTSKDSTNTDVWLVASSGMYLLKQENVALEYKDVYNLFIDHQM